MFLKEKLEEIKPMNNSKKKKKGLYSQLRLSLITAEIALLQNLDWNETSFKQKNVFLYGLN